MIDRNDLRIAENFLLRETSVSRSHPRLVEPLPNALGHNATRLAVTCAQPYRDFLGSAIVVGSWWRSTALNFALSGSTTSQHLRAEAVDLQAARIREAFEAHLRKDFRIPCGQVIYYPTRGFIHLALPSQRFPVPTFCVHWPAKRLTYRVIRGHEEFLSLVPLGV